MYRGPQLKLTVGPFGISKLPGNDPHFQGLFAVSFREDILYSFTSHHPIIHPSRWPEKNRTRSTRLAKQQPIGEAAAFDREKSRLFFFSFGRPGLDDFWMELFEYV